MDESRELRRFTDSAMARATGTSKHSGEGWAERHLEATAFGLPPTRERPKAKKPESAARHEVHGAVYAVTPLSGEDRHAGDPTPHGVPPEYAHPLDLASLIIEGAPRALPVTQEIEHGQQRSRAEEFDDAAIEAAELGAWHATLGYYDRRYEGRRHRSGFRYQAPQEPPTRGGWQRDVNTHERLTKF
jgi:hypothetical protein